VLGELVAAATERARVRAGDKAALENDCASLDAAPPFDTALRTGNVAVIAEVKRSSPSKGAINTSLAVGEQCRAYATGGAAAISVLTEPTRFGGSLEDLSLAQRSCGLPLLRKDFIVDEVQLLEARLAGASAVLLIVRALEPSRLRDLHRAARKHGLSALVEVRNEGELERALAIGASIIGVNNRNLETLEMDDAAQRVLPLIPRTCIGVAESGYRSADQVERAAGAGADAVLIGSELSAAVSPLQLMQSLIGIRRSENARKN